MANQIKELRNYLRTITKSIETVPKPVDDNHEPVKTLTISLKEKTDVLPEDVYEIQLNQITLEDEYVM